MLFVFFSVTACNILFLFFVLVVLMIICYGVVLFLSSLFGVLEASCTSMGIVFSRFGKFSEVLKDRKQQLKIFCMPGQIVP
jgi:hypothetical protein